MEGIGVTAQAIEQSVSNVTSPVKTRKHQYQWHTETISIPITNFMKLYRWKLLLTITLNQVTILHVLSEKVQHDVCPYALITN